MQPEPGRPSEVSRYDRVAYLSHPQSETQCRRLEATAALFGLSPTPPARARVLELGCGTADGLAWQALEYPGAQFIGCDSSKTAVAAGRELIRVLGADNVDLRLQDLCEVDAGWGTFDYIVCHGVFSWVGPDVRRRILDIFRHNLAPQGVGCITYNVLPGWCVRGVVRALMRRHTRGIDDPRDAIARAREILSLAAETHSVGGPFGPLLSRENNILMTQFNDGYVYHEMLAEHNQPFHFEEFLDQIGRAGLQYVGATEIAAMFAWDLPAKARAFLEGLPLLAREQYLDHLRGGLIRTSVVCRGEAPVDRRVDPATLERFAVRLDRAARFEVAPAGRVRLVIGACELPCPDPLTVTMLRHLDERRPEFVPMRELRQHALGQSGRPPGGTAATGGDAADPVLRFFLDALTAGAVEGVLSPPRVAGRVSERPVAHPLARHQAQRDRAVTNQHQEVVELGAVSRFVTGLLDGTRDHGRLAEMLRQELEAARIPRGPSDEAEDPERLIRQTLADLCRGALLVA